MARVKLPSYLNMAGGRMGDIVCYPRRGRMYSRKYVVPRNPDTEAQRVVRGSFRDAMNAWKALGPEEKAWYNKRTRKISMLGHNLFVSEYMRKALHTPGEVPGTDKEEIKNTSSASPSVSRIHSVQKSYQPVTGIINSNNAVFPLPG